MSQFTSARLSLAASLCNLLLASLSVSAQSGNYHTQFLNKDLFGNPANEPALHLLNDGPKGIEAFHIRYGCSGMSPDILSVNGGSGISNPGGTKDPSMSLSPGGTWYAGLRYRCAAEKDNVPATVDAVIYVDGTFDGDPATVRLLKATRDGIITAINNWAERVSREDPDRSNLSALLSDARHYEDRDRAGLRRYSFRFSPPPEPDWQAMGAYWGGRFTADAAILGQFPTLYSNPDKLNSERLVRYITRWKDRIDCDSAMQNLNVKFPPISDTP